MQICAMIIMLFFAAPLSEATRIMGFKTFSVNSYSQVKATPATSYPSVEERTPDKEWFSGRAYLENHPGSEGNLKPNVSPKSKASHQRSDELLQAILPSLNFKALQHQVVESVPPFQPLGHSPGIGHDGPPALRH